MIDRENTSQFQLNRLDAIKILLKGKDELQTFLLHPDRPDLTASAKSIMEDMLCFEEEDRVLLKLALCLWGEPVSDLGVGDVFDKLNGESFKQYMKALLFSIQNPCTERIKVVSLDDIISELCMGRKINA